MRWPSLILLIPLACARAAAIITPTVLPLVGDEPGYVDRALHIARTGLLPTAGVQPHGFSLLMSPLALLFGDRLAYVMRVVHALCDLSLVVLLVYLAGRLFADARWSGLRLVLQAAILFQPFTAMFAALIYTETMVSLMVFAAVWTLGAFAADRGYAALSVGTGLLALAGTCRVELAPLALLLPAWAIYRRRSTARAHPIWPSAVVVASSFAVVFGGFVAFQFLSTGDPAIVKARFHAAGYMRWLRTWVVYERETVKFAFGVLERGSTASVLAEYPDRAFDSEAERRLIGSIVAGLAREGYSRDADAAFEELGRSRAAAHPLRTWVVLPARRSLSYWLNLQGTQTYLRAIDLPRAVRWPLIIGVMALKVLLIATALVGAFVSFRPKTSFSPGIAELGQLCALLVVLRHGQLAALGTIAWGGLVESRYVLMLWAPLIALSLIGIRASVPAGEASREATRAVGTTQS